MKKVLYAIGAGVGGGLIGTFAGRLDSPLGANMLVLGTALLVFCIVKISQLSER